MMICFYQRIALLLVASFMLVFGAFFYATSYYQTFSQHEAEQQLHLGLAQHLANDNPILKEGVYDYAALENLFHTLMVLGPNFEFYYLDPKGSILTYSAEKGKVKLKAVDLTPINQILNSPATLPIYGDDPKSVGQQKIFSAAPVFKDGILQGYVYVIIGGEIYDSIIDKVSGSQSMRELALFIAAGMLALMVSLLVLFRYITKPLKKLGDDVALFRAANFSLQHAAIEPSPWSKDSENEIHKLGCAFNEMLIHIDHQMQQLQQNDAQRRTLFADLSHDLRTPLANLHGYIETLKIKSDTLSEQDRQRFIDISLKSASNLKRLIDQIFELAYLEGGQITLNSEPFSLGELLYDVAAKFSLKASKKDIHLLVDLQEGDVQVFADIGKLERVLTNLLENALRHTPQGGKILLVMTSSLDKIRVDIRDSGVGISEKEIAFIFDARYQASNSQKDSNIHAGLGLAISTKLIDLLDSKLQVQSELGKGTCFSFELAIAKN